MRFTSAQDYQLMLHFNQELLNAVVDTPVVLYKLNIVESKKNIYGESTSKRWYKGVQIPCLVNRQLSSPVKDGMTVNTEQSAEFHFLRKECEIRNVYPELGDIVDFAGTYFEIDQLNNIQLIAGQINYNHSITASAHLTRVVGLQLEAPLV